MCKKSAAKSAVKLGTVLQQIQRFNEKGFWGLFQWASESVSRYHVKKGDVQEICSEIRDRFATISAIQQQRFLRTISMGIRIGF